MTIKEIRKATLKDLKDLMGFNSALFKNEIKKFDNTLDINWITTTGSMNYFKKAITSKNYLVILALVDNVAIGYLIGAISDPEKHRKPMKIAEIQNMFIEEKYRGQNIGTDLINSFFKWAKLKKANRIKVVASSKNERGINFYKKNKFKDHEVTLEANF